MKPIAAAAALGLILSAAGLQASVDIPKDVADLFQKRCAGCHKGNDPSKGLNLEPSALAAVLDAPSREVPALKIVDTGSPDASYLLKKVRRDKDIAGKPMPPGKALSAEEIQVLQTWISGLKKTA
jgi:mono/diheme cytochrome c family protein